MQKLQLVLLGLILVFTLMPNASLLSAAKQPKGLQVTELNTHPFPCDGKNYDVDSGLQNVRVRKIIAWFGAYGYTNADIVMSVEHVDAAGQYRSIAKAGWDHYSEPTGVNGQTLTYDFAPDWIEVRGGESLHLAYACNPMNAESQTKKAHLIVLVYTMP